MRQRKRNNHTLIVVGSILLMFVIVVVAISWIFDFSLADRDSTAKIIAATLALLGVLFTGVIAAVGYVLKYAIDERNAVLQEEAENRLKLEAAIKGLALLGSETDAEGRALQKSGTLYTLFNLGLEDLALSLARNMLDLDQLDPITAMDLIDAGLQSKRKNIQSEAANLFCVYPHQFLTDDGDTYSPLRFRSWDAEAPDVVRQQILFGFLKLILARPRNDWKPGILNSLVVTLINVWIKEPNEALRNGAGCFLHMILASFPVGAVLHSPVEGDIDYEKYLDETQDLAMADSNELSFFVDILTELEQWLHQAEQNMG